jgi:hypothetical protein
LRATLCASAVVLLAIPASASARLTEDGVRPPGPLAEGAPAPQNLPERAENLDVVGRFKVPGVRPGQIADVAVHKGYAYLNSWDDPNCEGGGTYVVDIRNPSEPKQVAFIPAPPNYYHGEGAHVVSIKVPGFEGDILAVNDETYGSNLDAPCAPASKAGGGFDLYDVTDPANPKTLVQGFGDHVVDNPPGAPTALAHSYHSVFVWQDGPRAYLVASDNIEGNDVDIFDITDPKAPVQIGDFDLDQTFPEILAGEEANGGAVFLHDMVVKHIGGKPIMLADYWDAGYVQLDVSDPANPVPVADTTFSGEDPLLPGSNLTPEGNAHQAEFSFDNQFLLAADEDFGPFRYVVEATSGPTVGRQATGAEGDAVATIAELPDAVMNGPSVFVGNGCDPATIPDAPADDGDPNTEDIALVERGGTLPPPAPPGTSCGFANKFDNAQAKGWDGLIIFNQVRPDDGQVNMATGEGGIPGVHMRRKDALGPNGVLSNSEATPAPGTAGPPILISPGFDGWGYAHLYDAATGEELDAFAIPEALDERFASGFGDLSIHEFATDPTEHLAYSSYYAGGIRVFQYGRDIGLKQTGAWIDAGGSNFWGVEQFTAADGTRLIAGSDRDYGLVILRYTGPGAAAPPSCSAGSVRTAAGQAVRLPLTCSDANGNPLTRRIVQGPASGTLGSIEGDSVLYTPNAGFSGTDSVRFVANDGAADSQPAATTVVVDAAAPPTTPPTKPSNKVSAIKLGKYKNGRVVVRLTVPGPGRLDVTMRANVRRAKASAARVKTLAKATKRPTKAGSVRVVLKLSKANRRALARTVKSKKRVKATIRTAFRPTGGTTGTTRRTLVIR